MARWIFALVIFLALGGGGWWVMKHPQLFAGDAAKPPAPVVPTTTVELKDLEEFLSTSGEVRPAESTMVKSEVSGVVKVLKVAAGDHVERGDLLLVLDPKELKSQLDAQELTLRGMELRRDKASAEYERNKALWERKMIPGKEVQDSKLDLDMTENDLAVQRANIENIKQQLSKLEIRSPHAGIVLDLEAQIGAVIVGANSFSSGTVLMEIADMSRKKATLNLNEIDVMKVHAGMPVEATFDSIPGLKLQGKVVFVSPSAGGKSAGDGGLSGGGRGGGGGGGGSGNVRTFPVTVNFDQKDDRIRAGITATIKVPLGKATQVPAAKISAVFVEEESEQRYVFLKTAGDKFERRNVATGVTNHEFVEIKEGLKTGDVIALERPKSAPPREKKKKNNDWD